MSTWTRALDVAHRTPESRNRYIDFLRAVSILVVVFGHWLMAAPQMIDGELVVEHLLVAAPWTQFATWVLQVMPVFFVVGGYANAASWESASAAGVGYAAWLRSRMGRLVIPVLPLVAFWVIIGAAAGQVGVDPYLIRVGSVNALIALWFLAVYVLAVALVPITRAAWRRFGLWSFWGLVAMAAIVDWAALSGRIPDAGWANYVFIWVAVHQLGYLWRDGGLRGAGRALGWAALGAVALALLLNLGPYPASMVDVPGSEASNSAPPTVVLLALGMVQTGLLAALEPVANRWLKTGPALGRHRADQRDDHDALRLAPHGHDPDDRTRSAPRWRRAFHRTGRGTLVAHPPAVDSRVCSCPGGRGHPIWPLREIACLR